MRPAKVCAGLDFFACHLSFPTTTHHHVEPGARNQEEKEKARRFQTRRCPRPCRRRCRRSGRRSEAAQEDQECRSKSKGCREGRG